jgi:hypothetical protein
MPDEPTPPPVSPEMRRAVSRRGFLTGELKKAGTDAVKQLPAFGGLLGTLMRETEAQRDERLVENLWLLLMGRKPKPEESGAGLDLVRAAQGPDAKSDALVDILWALMQTRDHADLGRSDTLLVRGLYRLAFEREPTDDERDMALESLAEAQQHARQLVEGGDPVAQEVSVEDAVAAARVASLESLFTGLLRSGESVLRRAPASRRGLLGR